MTSCTVEARIVRSKVLVSRAKVLPELLKINKNMFYSKENVYDIPIERHNQCVHLSKNEIHHVCCLGPNQGQCDGVCHVLQGEGSHLCRVQR